MGNNAKQELYDYVDSLQNYLEIPLRFPINALELWHTHPEFEIIDHMFDTNGFCGAAYVGDRVDTIVLNRARSDTEQNFDCTHEVLHLTKHRTENRGIFQCFSENQKGFIEWQANEGAAQFLVPYQDFIPRFICNTPNTSLISYDVLENLADYYHVSVPVIKIRLDSLSYEIDQYRNGITIENIQLLSRNQQKMRGIQPSCYNNILYHELDWDAVI